MTLEQYIGNPMARSALLTATAREAMKTEYVKKYNEILLREHGKIDYKLYKDEKNNKFYAHFNIPSETIEKFYYDVVLEFSADEDIELAGQDLFKYNCRFYSNDPSFVYTYAHVFRTNDLFIEGLRNKMSRKAIKKAATEKNPYNQVGYVKTIYFAYLTMVRKGLNKLDYFKSNAVKMSMSALSSNVTDADKKIADREEAGRKLSRQRKREREEKSENSVPKVSVSTNIHGGRQIKKISSVKSINTISGKKKSKKK